MEYLFNTKVTLVTDHQNTSLYKWCLREGDEKSIDGNSDWVPFRWSFTFSAISLKTINSIEIKYDENSKENCTTTRRRISGRFVSGYNSDDDSTEREVIFEIFGTGRKLKYFYIDIYEVNHPDRRLFAEAEDEDSLESEERCNLTAFPSYESEGPEFTTEVEDDHAGFTVFLNPERFREIAALIEQRSIDSVMLMVSDVSGVYAHWTPTVVTRKAKLLTRQNIIDNSDGIDFEVSRVGQVGKFHISYTTSATLQVDKTPQIKGNFCGNNSNESDKFYDNPRDTALSRLTQLVKREDRWAIAIILVIISCYLLWA